MKESLVTSRLVFIESHYNYLVIRNLSFEIILKEYVVVWLYFISSPALASFPNNLTQLL